MHPTQSSYNTDALIIGAGPCGLFQAFQLGLQGIDCRIVEALDYPGGQCAELYPDKPIFDIPGIPRTDAGELTEQLLTQIRPFSTPLHLGQVVDRITLQPSGKFHVSTNANCVYVCRTIILATGAGAFSPVRMRVDGIERFEGGQMLYGDYDNQAVSGKNVVVTGDTVSAVQTAISVSEHASKTTLVHRKRRLQIDVKTRDALDQAIDNKHLHLLKGKISAFHMNDKLEHITVNLSAQDTLDIETDLLLPRLGNSPKNSAFEQWGLNLKHNHIEVDAATFETSIPCIYSIGDINTYNGKRKLILCGFHEATMAAFAIAKSLSPEKPVHTLYTTTSTELQKRLRVYESP